jgi:hypothetical protein
MGITNSDATSQTSILKSSVRTETRFTTTILSLSERGKLPSTFSSKGDADASINI